MLFIVLTFVENVEIQKIHHILLLKSFKSWFIFNFVGSILAVIIIVSLYFIDTGR